jgi:hypothetical protein
MPYTLAEASKATGTNKTTILRAIKSGKITGTKNEQGEWLVEPAELHRVYPPVDVGSGRSDARTTATQRDATPSAAVLEAEIAGLKAMAELLRGQLDDIREDRDRWHSQAEAAQRLLQHDRRPWWKRLAG